MCPFTCTFVSSQVYKSKTEAAKKEYLKALAAYRASLVSKVRNCFFFSPEKCVNLTEISWYNTVHCEVVERALVMIGTTEAI